MVMTTDTNKQGNNVIVSVKEDHFQKKCLFKYTENFTTKKKKKKNENFERKKNLILFMFLLKTQIVDTR